MNEENNTYTEADREIIAALTELVKDVKAGTPIAEKYTVRSVELNLQPRRYGPDDVRCLRLRLQMSQALFAAFLNVPKKTLQAWEQGSRKVPGLARRLLDEVHAGVEKDPEYGVKWLRQATEKRNPDDEPTALQHANGTA